MRNVLSNPDELNGPQKEKLLEHLKLFNDAQNIRRLCILDTQGKVILSTTGHTDLPAHYNRILSNDDAVVFSDVYKGKDAADSYLMLMTLPVVNKNQQRTGTLLAEMVVNPLFEQIQDRTGLGKTGETQLAKKIGRHIVFLNPMLQDPDAALKRRVPIGSKHGLPIQSSTTGNTGKGPTVDYLGHDVLASWRYIPIPGWGIVVKIDQSEVYADMEENLYAIVVTAVIILVFGIGASFRTAERLMRPIVQLDDSAHIDSLTLLPNRRFMTELLETALQEARSGADSTVALLFLDLDGFKAVNDTYGHETGDWLLKTVAQRLKNSLRSSDVMARLGGDEFVVILSDVKDAYHIEVITNKIIQEINEPFVLDKHIIRVGTSIGISMCTATECPGADVLLKHADEAMYLAKQSGKNQFRFYNETVQ